VWLGGTAVITVAQIKCASAHAAAPKDASIKIMVSASSAPRITVYNSADFPTCGYGSRNDMAAQERNAFDLDRARRERNAFDLDWARRGRNEYLTQVIVHRLQTEFDDTATWFKYISADLALSTHQLQCWSAECTMPPPSNAQNVTETGARLTDWVQKIHDKLKEIIAQCSEADTTRIIRSLSVFVSPFTNGDYQLECTILIQDVKFML
jgi:hypothetical protein